MADGLIEKVYGSSDQIQIRGCLSRPKRQCSKLGSGAPFLVANSLARESRNGAPRASLCGAWVCRRAVSRPALVGLTFA